MLTMDDVYSFIVNFGNDDGINHETSATLPDFISFLSPSFFPESSFGSQFRF